MNLREWGSNSREFINSVGEKDRAPTFTSKVLGIIWDCEKDLLVVPGPTCGNLEETSTKCEVLQVIGSVFDPLGYYSPSVFKGKTIHEDVMEGIKVVNGILSLMLTN